VRTGFDVRAAPREEPLWRPRPDDGAPEPPRDEPDRPEGRPPR